MYAIIYIKESGLIVLVIDRTKALCYGYTPDCAEMIVNEPPQKGKRYIDK